MNCIRVLLTGMVLAGDAAGKEAAGELVDFPRVKGLFVDPGFNDYLERGAISVESVAATAKILDVFSSSNTAGEGVALVPEAYRYAFDEEEAIKKVLEYKGFDWPDRVLFHAYTAFIVHAGGDFTGFGEWMRVFRNLAGNSRIESIDTARRALRTIEELLPHRRDILAYLADSTPANLPGFERIRVQEERVKARLIRTSAGWAEAIRQAEKNPYFTGQISFLLVFAGACAPYVPAEGGERTAVPSPLRPAPPRTGLDAFIQYSQKIDIVFNDRVWSSGPECLWERAVLSMGDYLQRLPGEYPRRNFLSSHANVRDHSWKRFLREPALADWGDPKTPEHDKRLYVKDVLDAWTLPAGGDRDEKMKALASLPGKTTYKNWYDLFIADPRLLGACRKGFIHVPEDGGGPILLYDGEQHNHSHAELFSWRFYLEYLCDADLQIKKNLSPFTEAGYKLCGGNGESFAYLYGLTYGEAWYEVIVLPGSMHSVPGDRFIVRFCRYPDNEDDKAYPAEMLELVRDMLHFGLKKSRDDTPHHYETKKTLTEKATCKILDRLCKGLAKIIE